VRSKLSSVSLKLSLALNAAFLIGACASDLKGTPVWNGKLWAGNPAAGEIWRTQDNPVSTISAFDSSFNNYTCMTYADLSCMYFSFVNNCQSWSTLTPSCPAVSNAVIKKLVRSLNPESKS